MKCKLKCKLKNKFKNKSKNKRFCLFFDGVLFVFFAVSLFFCFQSIFLSQGFAEKDSPPQIIKNSLPKSIKKPIKKSINVYNWGEYLSDGSNGSVAVNKEFEKLTGIKVNYSTFATNEELYAKLRNRSASYDVIIPSDYMISRMVKEDMLSPLNFDKIPNYKNIDSDFKNLEYDKENKYSVPYMWGAVGIIYNKSFVGKKVDSWSELWNRDYRSKILMFSNSRDCFAVALKKLGHSVNTTDVKKISEAGQEILNQKELVQAYVMDEIFNKMENNEAFIAPYYSGDAITMMKENPNLDFVYPKEGTNRFVDALCIPKGCRNEDMAHLYINFLLEPRIALSNTKYVGYSTPNKKAYELLDDEIKNNKVAYPDKSVMKKTESYLYLPPEINELIDLKWTEIMSFNQEDSELVVPLMLIFGLLFSVFINIYRAVNKRKKISLKT